MTGHCDKCRRPARESLLLASGNFTLLCKRHARMWWHADLVVSMPIWAEQVRQLGSAPLR